MTDALGASMGVESLLATGQTAMAIEDNTSIGPFWSRA